MGQIKIGSQWQYLNGSDDGLHSATMGVSITRLVGSRGKKGNRMTSAIY